MALVDEAAALIGTPPRTYGHVVVDEAQDLTPMQFRAVARRATDGALTLLGDVAQATGPVAYRSRDAARREGVRVRPGDRRRARARRPEAAGLRELYVALTRRTRSLVVLHARPLPAPLA
ncbi:MAG TPA: hypothetical protein VEY87_06405 [Gaiellaceae bacterium]|nr:hypothetical protein [Gaiellaceae bacterium]